MRRQRKVMDAIYSGALNFIIKPFDGINFILIGKI